MGCDIEIFMLQSPDKACKNNDCYVNIKKNNTFSNILW
jgi:hypothetical protein